MDGRLLALARDEKEKQRRESMAADDRRHREAYAKIPRLRALDGQITALVGEVVSSVTGSGRPLEEIRAESLELQAQRAELLVENGFPMTWLDGAWHCPKCRDTGYVEGRTCSCLLELYEKEKAKSLSALLKLGNERFDTFRLDLYDDTVDPEAGISPREQMTCVFEFCRDYAQSFEKAAVNLLFQGGTGLGKTFLSACVAQVVSEKGYSVVYETAVAALAAMENRKFHPDEASEERVKQLLSCDLLILDDLGTEMVTDFSKSALYTILNSRLLSEKCTLISTNLNDTALEKLYTPQIYSRLRGDYQLLHFVGTDIRMLKSEARL